MDELSEVNWSEVCRNAISAYVVAKKNPTPQIDLLVTSLVPRFYPHRGPELEIALRFDNRMPREVEIDRMIFEVALVDKGGKPLGLLKGSDLQILSIGPNSFFSQTIYTDFNFDWFVHVDEITTRSFYATVSFTVYVRNFKQSVRGSAQLTIQKEEWKDVADKIREEFKLAKNDR
jgi:hypothetical protein